MIIILKHCLVNFDHVKIIECTSDINSWYVVLVLDQMLEDKRIVKEFDSRSSAESFMINDFVRMLDTDKKILDLRNI